MERNDNAVEKAITYFEDAIKKNDEKVKVLEVMQKENKFAESFKELLTEQRGHFATALNALRDVAEKEG